MSRINSTKMKSYSEVGPSLQVYTLHIFSLETKFSHCRATFEVCHRSGGKINRRNFKSSIICIYIYI